MHLRFNELMNNAGFPGDPWASDCDRAATSSPYAIAAVIQAASERVQHLQGVPQMSVDSASAITGPLSKNSESQSGTPDPSLLGDIVRGSSRPDVTQYQAPAAKDFELDASDGNIGDAVSDENGSPRLSQAAPWIVAATSRKRYESRC
jgi:hypothetical protein